MIKCCAYVLYVYLGSTVPAEVGTFDKFLTAAQNRAACEKEYVDGGWSNVNDGYENTGVGFGHKCQPVPLRVMP